MKLSSQPNKLGNIKSYLERCARGIWRYQRSSEFVFVALLPSSWLPQLIVKTFLAADDAILERDQHRHTTETSVMQSRWELTKNKHRSWWFLWRYAVSVWWQIWKEEEVNGWLENISENQHKHTRRERKLLINRNWFCCCAPAKTIVKRALSDTKALKPRARRRNEQFACLPLTLLKRQLSHRFSCG